MSIEQKFIAALARIESSREHALRQLLDAKNKSGGGELADANKNPDITALQNRLAALRQAAERVAKKAESAESNVLGADNLKHAVASLSPNAAKSGAHHPLSLAKPNAKGDELTLFT